MSRRAQLTTAAILGMIAVILGAFGAHGLKELLTPDQLTSYHTGVRYQFYHAFALFASASLMKPGIRSAAAAAWLFLLGVILFSGSIYMLSCREVIGLTSYKWLGPITPLGGALLIAGWACLIPAAWKSGEAS